MRISLRFTFLIVPVFSAALAYAEDAMVYETIARYRAHDTRSCPMHECPPYSLGPFDLDEPLPATDSGKIFWAKLHLVKADRHPSGFDPKVEVNDMRFHIDEIREVPFVTASWTKEARVAYIKGGDVDLDITFANPTDHRVGFVFKVMPGAYEEVSLKANEEKTVRYRFSSPSLHTTGDAWDFFILSPFSRTATGVGPLREKLRQENAASFTINVEGAFTIDTSQTYINRQPAVKVSVR